MKNNQTKTDNSYLEGKIILRLSQIADINNIKVLDCFGGKGIIWQKIKERTNKKIEVVSLEIEKHKNIKAIEGDNLKILPVLDLSEFDVIDIDAYGSPYKQLKAIVNNGSYQDNVIIFTTDIQTMKGIVPDELLLKSGINKKMIKKCPTMFSRKFTDISMINYLAELNVEKAIEYRPTERKKYRTFKLKKVIIA